MAVTPSPPFNLTLFTGMIPGFADFSSEVLLSVDDAGPYHGLLVTFKKRFGELQCHIHGKTKDGSELLPLFTDAMPTLIRRLLVNFPYNFGLRETALSHVEEAITLSPRQDGLYWLQTKMPITGLVVKALKGDDPPLPLTLEVFGYANCKSRPCVPLTEDQLWLCQRFASKRLHLVIRAPAYPTEKPVGPGPCPAGDPGPVGQKGVAAGEPGPVSYEGSAIAGEPGPVSYKSVGVFSSPTPAPKSSPVPCPVKKDTLAPPAPLPPREPILPVLPAGTAMEKPEYIHLGDVIIFASPISYSYESDSRPRRYISRINSQFGMRDVIFSYNAPTNECTIYHYDGTSEQLNALMKFKETAGVRLKFEV